MINHTRTPWKLNGVSAWHEGFKDRGNIFSCNLSTGTHVPNEQNYTNAAFIVQCVNSHEVMLCALKLAITRLDFEDDSEAHYAVRDAIAEAEGKKP